MSQLKVHSTSTAAIVFNTGEVLYGKGFGAEGIATGELCFNTGMTGYQEIITDPSYADQIINFTFPHIGNIGTNVNDNESLPIQAKGIISRQMPSQPSNWRSSCSLIEWLTSEGKIGIAELDTRAIARKIRINGVPNVAIQYSELGKFDIPQLTLLAQRFSGLSNLDLAKTVTCSQEYGWNQGVWSWEKAFFNVERKKQNINVVAIDFGTKQNILRILWSKGCDITIVPATSTFEEIMAHKPDGIFLSNGPGDPEATAKYTSPVIRDLIFRCELPIFGICLGHQILAIALGAQTKKMKFGHRGTNHPVKNLKTGKVEITSMNHGFTVNSSFLPESLEETHTSLFDGSNCGIKMKDRPIFSVQYHPEASPGPQDSYYLFDKFVDNIKTTILHK